jgi:dihydrofolate reductase
VGRLVVHEFVSVDGFASDERGRFDFFSGDSNEIDVETQVYLRTTAAILLGAVTYREFVQYWPTPASARELLADRINELPKYVASTTLTAATWGSFAAATVIGGDVVGEVERLKRELGGDIIVWGSLELCSTLFAAGLVDCVRLVVVPTVLGAGRTVFPSSLAPPKLTLAKSGSFDDGLVMLEYHVG